jgi:archaellum component FlaC
MKEIDDRILRLKKEQLNLSASYEQVMNQLNQVRVRYQQTVGAVAELESLQKQINNGSEPPP